MLQDARVLRDQFVPREVEHRDQEVNELSNALRPVIRGDPAQTAFLFGPSGTGKTCIARFTVERLQEETIDIDAQYVNCWQNYNRASVLHRVLEGLGKNPDIHRRSTPKTELLNWIKRRDSLQYMVILDEADQLEDDRILYDLHSVEGLSMILIANREEELFAGLDERVVSRIRTGRKIQFDRYGIDEMVAILEARARRAFHPDAIGSEELELIADVSAGDARTAIAILRKAAQKADEKGAGEITVDLIEETEPQAREELWKKKRDQLNPHQKALLEIIEDAGEIEPSDLYERYEQRIADPKSDRTVRNYLQKMVHYDLIKASGEKRGRTYQSSRPTGSDRA